jgi:transcriptional regulator with XRE-family HTH domain
MYYGNKIRFLRKKRGLTQQEIARKLSMSQKSYSNIENNKCDVRLTKFLKLSLILGFRPADFFKDTAIFLNQPLNTMESVYVENLYLKKEINHYKALVQDKKNIITLLKKQITRNKTVRS